MMLLMTAFSARVEQHHTYKPNTVVISQRKFRSKGRQSTQYGCSYGVQFCIHLGQQKMECTQRVSLAKQQARFFRMPFRIK